jgi:hypothetical protein
MVLAGIQKNNLDTGLRRYDARDLDTHLCGVALRLPAKAKAVSVFRAAFTPVLFTRHG